MATNRQPTETGRGRTSGGGARLRGRSGQEPDRPNPWRVEGMPDSTSGAQDRRPRSGGFWMFLIAALVINWILA